MNNEVLHEYEGIQSRRNATTKKIKHKNGAASYTNKEKAITLDQFFSSQLIIEDNNDIPDGLEFVTVKIKQT